MFGRWTKVERLADPDDVFAGHVVRFERAAHDRIVRSPRPAHPAIVPVADFTRLQLARRARSAGGIRRIGQLERVRTGHKQTLLLRGLVRCEICSRKMQGELVRRSALYYRCNARTLTPGAAALADHPRTVNLREEVVTAAINRWIGGLFNRDNVDETVRALVASQSGPTVSAGSDAAKARLKKAEEAVRRLQDAILAGMDPGAVKEAINGAQAEREAARAEVESAPKLARLEAAEVYAMIDALGDVGGALERAQPDSLIKLYQDLGIGVSYQHREDGGVATIALRVVNADFHAH